MYTGAILAGGRSLRMGQPKEGVLMSDGRTMIEHVIEPLSHLCQKIVIVGDCLGFSVPPQASSRPQQNFIALKDDPPGKGPLSAITTLLKSGIDPNGYIVTACDQPFLTSDLLRLLLKKTAVPTIFQPEQDEMMIPFPGYYPVSWLSIIENELASGEYGICHAILKSTVEYVSLSKEQQRLIRNINTPDELQRR